MALSFVTYGNDHTVSPALTEPTTEPVSLDEVKRQVRREEVDFDNAYLEATVIPAVRERAEQATGRQLPLAVWDLKLDAFPCGDWIDVPKPPLVSVVRIQYVDTNGDTQTWASTNYVVDAPSGPRAQRGRIALAYNVSWPTTRAQMNAVTIRFVAGYSVVPPRLKWAMLLDAGSLYENREDQIVGQGYVISAMPTGCDAVYRSFKSHPRQR